MIFSDFSELSLFFAKKRLFIEEKGMFHAAMNETLSVVLITNLLKNAFVHNIDKGVVKIEISASSVRIGNTGIDKTLDGKRIFERLYQGTKKEGSTGLGLAIVYSICRQSQLRIRYEFVKDMHWMVLSR